MWERADYRLIQATFSETGSRLFLRTTPVGCPKSSSPPRDDFLQLSGFHRFCIFASQFFFSQKCVSLEATYTPTTSATDIADECR